jgi:hypothetical protein
LWTLVFSLQRFPLVFLLNHSTMIVMIAQGDEAMLQPNPLNSFSGLQIKLVNMRKIH